MDEKRTNKELIEEKIREKDPGENERSLLFIIKKYRILLIYCAVVLTYYVIRYVVIPNM